MYCARCSRHIAYCKCEDINKRLAEIAKVETTKDLGLGGIEQRVEEKAKGGIRPEIEFLLNHMGEVVKVTFESKRHAGIYYLTGKVIDVNPSIILFIPEETDYPEGIFNALNTSRLRSAELKEAVTNADKSAGHTNKI